MSAVRAELCWSSACQLDDLTRSIHSQLLFFSIQIRITDCLTLVYNKGSNNTFPLKASFVLLHFYSISAFFSLFFPRMAQQWNRAGGCERGGGGWRWTIQYYWLGTEAGVYNMLVLSLALLCPNVADSQH